MFWRTCATTIAEHLLDVLARSESLALLRQLAPRLDLILQNLSDLPSARAAFERALAILEQRLPPGHPTIERVRSNLESVR